MGKRVIAVLAIFGAAMAGVVEADPPEGSPCVYRIDPMPIAQTPKHLGVSAEVMHGADRANLWDWLADSGVSMVRLGHPDTTFRKSVPASERAYQTLRMRSEFDGFRTRLLADPEKNIPWD